MRTILILLGCGISLLLVVTSGSSGRLVTVTGFAQTTPGAGDPAGEVGIVTTGLASDLRPGAPLTGCTSGLVNEAQGGNNFNAALVGFVTSADGQRFAVPAPVHDGPAAVDAKPKASRVPAGHHSLRVFSEDRR